MESEVNAYRAEPDPVGYSSADEELEEDEQVIVIDWFKIISAVLLSLLLSLIQTVTVL